MGKQHPGYFSTCAIIPVDMRPTPCTTASSLSCYAVVHFLMQSEVAVVPMVWVENRDLCKWPPFKTDSRVQRAVKDRIKPEVSWESFKIKIVYESESYEKAMLKLKSAELTSSLETDEEDNPTKKRKRKPNARYESDDEDDSDSDKSSSPIKKKADNGTNKSKSCSLPPLPPLPVLTPVKQVLHQSTGTPTLRRSPRRSLLGSVTSPQPRSDSPVTVKERKILSILEEIKTQVYVNSKLLQLLSKKVDVNISTEDYQLPQQMKLPLESEADMEKMEELLLDKDVYAKLVHHLATIGGDSTEMCVRRILKTLMTNSLAVKFNWIGKGGKLPFQGLYLRTVIEKSVRKNRVTSDATNKDIENTIKEWLRYAKDRNGGRKKRAEKKRREEEEAREREEETQEMESASGIA